MDNFTKATKQFIAIIPYRYKVCQRLKIVFISCGLMRRIVTGSGLVFYMIKNYKSIQKCVQKKFTFNESF